jgi:hypothetical protein
MITEETIIYDKEKHNKEDYIVQAFVIDGEVVDIFAISKTFLNIFYNSELLENSFENGRYLIDIIQDSKIVDSLFVPEKLGAILLSNPMLIELNAEKNNYQVVPGMKYVDGINWSY